MKPSFMHRTNQNQTKSVFMAVCSEKIPLCGYCKMRGIRHSHSSQGNRNSLYWGKSIHFFSFLWDICVARHQTRKRAPLKIRMIFCSLQILLVRRTHPKRNFHDLKFQGCATVEKCAVQSCFLSILWFLFLYNLLFSSQVINYYTYF